MCGICGFSGKKDPSVLKAMTAVIVHRGPDEDGFYSDGKINLGVRRLSIIDVTTGHQPVHNEDQTLWTVFNGEIYNSYELRKELEERGHQFYTDHSDTEVIVHLYEEYGSNFVQEINGMFAIALWDKRGERLLLIRDRMGVKPLFYALTGDKIIFGSEIKTILTFPDYHREANFEALYHYFSLKNIPAPLTAFKGILSLLPGERVIFYRGGLTKERWWKIEYNERDDHEEGFVKERILTLLEDATRLRMISDVPFGAYLSGGVDSSSIVALMTKFTDKPVKTFSLGYEDDLKNKEADLYYARRVSKTYQAEHYEYIMSCKELIDEIENVICAFDQPFSGTISTYFLTKLISKHVKVALTGDAADELFGSYLSHRLSQPMFHYKRLYPKVRNKTLTAEEKSLFQPCDIHFLDDLYQKSGGEDSKWRYLLGVFTDEEKGSLLTDGFKSNLDSVTSCSLFIENFSKTTSKDPLNRVLEMEWNTQLPDQVLAFVDFLSMAHSVEIRSPFLDYRLVEFVATLPGRMKIKNGVVKDILKQTVQPLLPDGITERAKEGFVLPIYDWMGKDLKSYILNVLSPKRLSSYQLFNLGTVKKIIDEFYSGKKDNAVKVWNLVIFQIWWEKYFG
jgi:asparagine synthase (glutamine-hydrolysing)